MDIEEIKSRIPDAELVFTSSRSSGPGGQNVNKVSTRVELRFNIYNSASFSLVEKDRIISALGKKITSTGEIIVRSQSERTQFRNKQKATQKFFQLLYNSLLEKPDRISTSPTLTSVNERITDKKKRGSLKKLRRASDEIHYD
jgi:ribosome-associated protein